MTQPTIAFHHQPTVVVGPNDLARELFRQDASSTFRRPVARAASWGESTASVARPRNRTGAALLCAVCMLFGIAAGHLVREGRAYAGASDATPIREAHSASVERVTARAGVRAKDVGSPSAPIRSDGRPPRAARAPHAPKKPPGPPIALDALFVDFEPTFRVGQ